MADPVYLTAQATAARLGCSKRHLPMLPLQVHRPTGKRGMYRLDEVEALRVELEALNKARAALP